MRLRHLGRADPLGLAALLARVPPVALAGLPALVLPAAPQIQVHLVGRALPVVPDLRVLPAAPEYLANPVCPAGLWGPFLLACRVCLECPVPLVGQVRPSSLVGLPARVLPAAQLGRVGRSMAAGTAISAGMGVGDGRVAKAARAPQAGRTAVAGMQAGILRCMFLLLKTPPISKLYY